MSFNIVPLLTKPKLSFAINKARQFMRAPPPLIDRYLEDLRYLKGSIVSFMEFLSRSPQTSPLPAILMLIGQVTLMTQRAQVLVISISLDLI